jgi:hypothetical protein
MNQEKTLEEKLRELSLDDLNKITYKKIVSSAHIKEVTKRTEVRAKISAANSARVVSGETKAKISATNKGRVFSDEHKAKLKGRVFSDEHKAKLCSAKKGRVMSDETKAKISATKKGKGRIMSDETKVKMVRGSSHGLAKLNEAQVLEIRSKYKPIHGLFKMISQEYGISTDTVRNIINRKTWNHI